MQTRTPSPVGLAFRAPVVARVVGISYRQLDYWSRTGLVSPTVRGSSGEGIERLYGFNDIVLLRIVKRLLDIGVSLTKIRSALDFLKASNALPKDAVLVSDGCSVYLVADEDELAQVLAHGNGIFAIALHSVRRELEIEGLEGQFAGVDPAVAVQRGSE